MKKEADKRWSPKEFTVGDWVLLKLYPYKQQSLAKKVNFKLAKRYFRPYQIVQRVGQVAYRLKLPPESKVHAVFHVSLLKPYIGPLSVSISNLPESPSSIPRPAAIIDRRLREEQGRLSLKVLVKWEGQPCEDMSWVSWEILSSAFPEYDLEGKVLLDLGGDDMNPNKGMGQDEDAAQNEEAQDSGTKLEGVESSRVRRRPIWTEDYVM